MTFDDVAGQDAAVTELREISDFLSDTERYAELGAQIPRGVLLYGPPGCGKTLMARALAGESGAAFFSISGSDFVEMYVGVGAARVRSLFKEAREHAPSIIFIDELDSVGRRRTGSGPGGAGLGGGAGPGAQPAAGRDRRLHACQRRHRARRDEPAGRARPRAAAPGPLRPRDRSRAAERARRARPCSRVHARGKPLAPDVDLASIANRTVGMTGADLASIFNEAALLTARARRTSIEPEDIEAALERVRDAPERQRRLSMRDRSIGKSLAALRARDVRRRRRAREHRRGARRGARVPCRPREVRAHGRARADRLPARRPARHRQDAARPRARRRVQRGLHLRRGDGVQRGLRRRGRGARARPLRAGARRLAGDRLHRRARRDRRPARRPADRQQRARADAQPAADRARRVPPQLDRHRHGRDEPARHARLGAHAARAL